MLAPIVLFTYNRPSHTKQTIDALLLNEYAKDSDLIIYSDGAKNEQSTKKVAETRIFLKSISGFKSIRIIERQKNYGLSKNIIEGVSEIVNKYGFIIVLEDDMVTSPYFLKYMNEALTMYEHEKDVISIHGYVYPIKQQLPETFFIKGADCWGWATWKRGWDIFNSNGKELLKELENKKLCKQFDFNSSYPYTKMLRDQISGKNDSWAIRWYASAFLQNKLTLYPGRSLISQIGIDGSGTNCGTNNYTNAELSNNQIKVCQIEICESESAKKTFIKYFKHQNIDKLKHYIYSLINKK